MTSQALRRRWFRTVIALCVVALVAASCTTDEPEAEEPQILEVPRLVSPERTAWFDPATGVIRIGVLADLSGPGAAIARSQLAGAEAYWSTVNAAGGIDGRFPVELVVRDTGGSSASAVQAYSEIHDTVAMFGQLIGTNTTDAVRVLLGDDGILGVPTTRQSLWASTPALLPIGASYAMESVAGISHHVTADGAQRVWCVVTDASAEGRDSLFGALIASNNFDEVPDFGTLTEDGAFDRVFDDGGPGSETAIVAEAQTVGCERVWLAGSSGTNDRFIAAASVADAEFQVGVGSEVSLPLGNDVAGWARDHLIVAVDAPSWGDAGAGARALRDAAASFVPDVRPNQWLRAGFASQYVVDVLLTTSARAGDLSHQALSDLAGSLEPIDTGGLAGSLDRSGDVVGVPAEVTIHVVDEVGVDPLGLRVEAVLTPAAATALLAALGIG